MNNPRRKELRRAMGLMAEAREIIEAMAEEEQESFDNMPECFQMGERGEAIQEKAEELDSIKDELEDLESRLEEVVEG